MAVIANTSPEVMEMVEKSAAKSSKRPAARTSTKDKDTKTEKLVSMYNFFPYFY